MLGELKPKGPKGKATVIRKEAWPFYRTISGIRLYWVFEEPKGPKGTEPAKGPKGPKGPKGLKDLKAGSELPAVHGAREKKESTAK